MPIFLCRWPNGDFSVVKAANKDQAIEFLDEDGNAEGCPITTMKHFMVHFGLGDDGEFVLQSFGELTLNQIMQLGYPVLTSAREGQEAIRLAVSKERQRIKPRTSEEPRTLVGRRMKAAVDMPSKIIDGIVEEESKKTLRKFNRKGKAN